MNNKIIIYDDNCPLCAAYTNVFVKTGLIPAEGRKDFSSITPELLQRIDLGRSVNEIPVLDTGTNQVWYGIDALLEILQQKMPWIKTIGNCRPVKFLLQQLYSLISYNRRVIVATANKTGNVDCTPDFNFCYRIFFMALFLVFNTWMLFPLHRYVLNGSIINGDVWELQAAHFFVVLLNISIAFWLGPQKGVEYLGQVNMLAVSVILLCVPLILLNRYAGVSNSLFSSFYFGVLSFFTVHEYTRRFTYIGFNKTHSGIVLLNVLSIAASIIYLLM